MSLDVIRCKADSMGIGATAEQTVVLVDTIREAERVIDTLHALAFGFDALPVTDRHHNEVGRSGYCWACAFLMTLQSAVPDETEGT